MKIEDLRDKKEKKGIKLQECQKQASAVSHVHTCHAAYGGEVSPRACSEASRYSSARGWQKATWAVPLQQFALLTKGLVFLH